MLYLIEGFLYPVLWLAVGLPLQLPALLSRKQTELGSGPGSVIPKELNLGELGFISLAFSKVKKAVIVHAL